MTDLTAEQRADLRAAAEAEEDHLCLTPELVLALLAEIDRLRKAIDEHLEDCPLYLEQEMDIDGMPYSGTLRAALQEGKPA